MKTKSLLAASAAALLALASAQAQTNNYTGVTAGSWATGTNWSLGTVPTSSNDVFSANATSVRINGGTAAVAGNLTIGGSTGTSEVQLRQGASTSLTVSGNITLAPGAGTGTLALGVGSGGIPTLTINGGSGSILDGGGAGSSIIDVYGLMGTLGLTSATADNLNLNKNSSGSLTIGSGQTYTIGTTALGSATANVTDSLTVNGTLVSTTLTTGPSAASGTNNATFTLNTGGLVQATTIQRTGSQTTTFNWDGGTIQNKSGGNLTVQSTGGNTLTISLAGTGTHTFEAESGRTITVQSTAVLADKSGENGTLTKAGLGTLTLNGTNTYTGPTTISAGTLVLASGGSIANSSTISVSAGATFDVAAVSSFAIGTSQTLKGSGTVTGNTTINGNLQPGNSPGVLTFNGSLTLASTATTTMEINGTTRGTQYDGIDMGSNALTYGGNLTLDFGTTFGVGNYTFDLFSFSVTPTGSFATGAVTLTGNYTGSLVNNSGVWSLTSGNNTWTFTQSTGDLGLTVVPEPTTWAMLGIGLTALVVSRRRRRMD